MNLITFQPIYKERVWGGRAFADLLNRDLPEDTPIGESWEIVDRTEAQSVATCTGKMLRELLRDDSEAIMGPGFDPERPFPILVKWLDCSQRLSLQVHPPEDVAKRLDGEQKTECWYVADAREGASLIVGLREGATRQQFEQAIHDEELEPLLHRFEVQPGDVMLLESGRLHAIDAGNLILEIQENSDTTYRVYDWGRKGLDGKPRALHVAESLESIDFDDFEPRPNAPFTETGEHTVAECAPFRLRRINLEAGQSISLPANQEPRIISIVRGALRDETSQHSYTFSENILVPYSRETILTAPRPASILVTDRFV